MVNPINNDDAALMLSKFGTKYLAEGAHTDVSASQFVAQAETTLTVLTGGDAAISDNNKNYLASMSLGSVELKAGALIVAPNGESFKSITVATGGALVAYNSVIEGVKPGSFVGLLDTYPDAAAAYSLRRLRTEYSGSAIRVRRTDNTEQDIGFVNNELDTTYLATFCGATDGFVVTYYDQSGEGADITQATAANQPKIYDSSTGVLLHNGKPTMSFNGTSQFLESSATIDEVNVSFLGVYYNVNIDNPRRPIGVRSDASASKSTFAQIENNSLAFDGDNLAGSITATVRQKLVYATKSNTAASSYINGVSNISSAISLNNTIGNFNLGNAHKLLTLHFEGNIQEAIFYPANKDTDRVGMDTNINNFYSIY